MPRPQRLVRRQPLSERLKAKLNPLDFLLWLSEEIETRDWDSRSIGIQLGIVLNFVFLLARANSADSSAADDVFGDSPGSSWRSFFVRPLVWLLVFVSTSNAFYAINRSRHYRLFEANIESGMSTPSAKRVRVDSSPVSSSPLRLLSGIIGTETAESRAHPDKTRDVWEISVWDPLPLSMHLFCLFSPGHILIYLLSLPLTPLDPRPSVTVFNCVLLQVMLTAQLLLLHSRYSQQSKDTAIIQKEVLHEYDSKYVHPHLHPVVREAGTQVSLGESGVEQEEIETGTPTTLIRRGFKTHPNPNYAKYYDPDYAAATTTHSHSPNVMSPSLFTPTGNLKHSKTHSAIPSQSFRSSGFRQSLPPSIVSPSSPAVSTSTSTGAGPTSFGGNLGVYSHANSPLKKATSLGDMKSPGLSSPRNSREMAALEQRHVAERLVRQSSPLKDRGGAAQAHPSDSERQRSMNPFANPRANRFNQERYPSILY
ncbi:hypothetical protein VTK73DRAFT_5833 [Phialemonium thermophilum]|uniref:Meiotically up-regulated gene 154 protein n=1 Tax=Phialemonium thermophilum TaxID=223376 RepID=A0ABR3WM21_9PEZI